MENSPYPCPACGAPADLMGGCTGCRRPPDREAAEVIRLDRDLVALGADVERARLAYAELAARFQHTRQRRAELADRVRARVAAPVVPLPERLPPRPPADPGQPETSARTMQGLLFVLGGLLLGTAAVVFTAVAWASVGIVGRALILAAFTALALTGPLVAVRRGLRGTAETFAAVGLLLVLLDGYAAWSVDLGGVADWPGTRYAALVGGASAAVAAGYARLSRLTGPWFAALVAAQPVLPLLVAEAGPAADGWAATLVGVALLDLAVLAALTRGAARGGAALVAGRVLAWTGFGLALVAAAGGALVSLGQGRAAGTPLLAGLPLLLVAATVAGAALLAGDQTFRQVAIGALVPVLGAGLLRPVAELRPSELLLATAVVAAGLAGGVVLLPTGWRRGPRVAALLVAAGATAVTVVLTALFALNTVGRSLPPWGGGGLGPDLAWGWQLPVAVALAVAAVSLSAPRAVRSLAGPVGLAVTLLAVPAGWPSPWPAVVAVDLVGAAVLLLAVAGRPRWAGPVPATAAAGALLLGHGLLVALAAPVGALTALGSVVVLGLVVAALGRRAPAAPVAVTGPALTAALLAVPAGVAVALLASGAPSWWQSRGALAAAGLLFAALLAVRRHWPELGGYASTALAAALTVAGVAPVLVPADEPVALYAALAVLPLAAGLRSHGDDVLRTGGSVLVVVTGAAAAPALLAALVTPYGRTVAIWSGPPVADAVPASLPSGLALVVLAVAAALAGRAYRASRWTALLAALPFAAAACPVLLVAAGAPWPVTPAVSLLLGVAALLAAALAAPRRLLVPVTVPVGLPLVAASLAGLVATRAGTLAGLGVLVVAATVAGAAGRRVEARIVGSLAAVAAGVAFALAASLAGGLPLREAAFAVLGVAALTLAAAAVTAGAASRRRVLDVAAQAVALVALLLAVGALRHAAAICVLWGAAVGVRVLRRGEPVDRRWAFAGIAGGSELIGAWLLLASGGVVLLEAYTLPAAALALAAGLTALRSRPELTSWLAFGPGLGAALLPGLVSVLVAPEPQPWRRLLLGVAALGAVLGGSTRRWQAPVLLGGATLAVLALHELVRGWDLLPRWIFLAAGGLALIGLAATYERRRRDLLRLRGAVGRMG
ncbi:hypothetical protein [Micromonospora sp. WMMD812]|uniref:SCO7613 C-terminal domain-containing membrane protein n=1 Tax=Micromonospora sp. WMMD812 TaxID=3015152 RepID=UPI00248C7B7C|nr:hypothetical protein [Micromonospora sp. WMMD812]WBB66657.1 hypothetical protein O7603_26475 [Micromonospora sp. WMMD812]